MQRPRCNTHTHTLHLQFVSGECRFCRHRPSLQFVSMCVCLHKFSHQDAHVDFDQFNRRQQSSSNATSSMLYVVAIATLSVLKHTRIQSNHSLLLSLSLFSLSYILIASYISKLEASSFGAFMGECVVW